ncbi:hypothetical protein Scep_004605 [Stephania cephalantha]|uniref:Uncharacterized protein n=1 Tax=Stephania cephalantha TaxID=152367 RepID=A0AAP0KSS0_9MAGN
MSALGSPLPDWQGAADPCPGQHCGGCPSATPPPLIVRRGCPLWRPLWSWPFLLAMPAARLPPATNDVIFLRVSHSI